MLRSNVVGRFGRVLAAIAATLAIGLVLGTGDLSAETVLRLEPAKVAGPDACGECHQTSIKVWKGTHHSTTFKDLPRSKKAKKIAKAMGLKRIKADSQCLTCHFTTAILKDKPKPIAGITCESCHAAGKDWIKVHGDYGGKKITRENEDPAHKKERYAKAEAAGMIRPARLYDVAANCYSCHTVPNEKLVNVGGHPAGSKFELVAWSQGEVRHNVWYTKENGEATQERKRMMYVVGQALDLEFALRGVAKATTKDKYAKRMAKRAKAAKKKIAAIAAAVKVPEIDAIVAAGGSAKLKLNNDAALSAAADKVAAAAKKIAASYDGSTLGGVDGLLPQAKDYKGTPAPAQ
jgi:putative intracellular protease/amidase